MPPTRNTQLNTALGVLSLLGIIGTVVFFIAPLKTLPSDVRAVQGDVSEMQRTQAVQTQALQTLAEVAKDSKDLRRDVDKHGVQIEVIQEKLKKLE